ncbi:hypothetical protein HK098_007017 [Nowakowskiella sp. JEL0407]|nr:hypothetical protein HK098_007017 [Nowakowskiella sp. JEL0407]
MVAELDYSNTFVAFNRLYNLLNANGKRKHTASKKYPEINKLTSTAFHQLSFASNLQPITSTCSCTEMQLRYQARLALISLLLDYTVVDEELETGKKAEFGREDWQIMECRRVMLDENKDLDGTCVCGSKTQRSSIWWWNSARVVRGSWCANDADFKLYESYLIKAINGETSNNPDKSSTQAPFVLESDENQETAICHATTALSLFLCQQMRNDEASDILVKSGFEYRVSPNVLRYPTKVEPGPWRNDIPFVSAVDNALPDELFNHMISNFNDKSLFWTQHNYSQSTPYFSYVHSLNTNLTVNKPESALDRIIAYLHSIAVKLFPQAADAKYAEWWAHNRPHHHGHQLHFDSDNEGKTRQGGKPRHPIVSSVLYLEDGFDVGSGTSVGGPTLVTNQRLGDPLADRGWLVYPKKNRYAVFDGSVLHGVIPGWGAPSHFSKRRITFMVAFWKEVSLRPSIDETPGSCRPFPSFTKTSYTWHLPHNQSLKPPPESESNKTSLNYIKPFPLENVWTSVKQKESTMEIFEDDLIDDYCEFPYSDESRKRYGLDIDIPPYESCFQGF